MQRAIDKLEPFQGAISKALFAAIGGLLNAMLHLSALAHELGLTLAWDDARRGRRVAQMDLLVEFFTEHEIFIERERFAAFDRYFKGATFYECAQRTRRPFDGIAGDPVRSCAPIFHMNPRTYSAEVSAEAIAAIRGIPGLSVTSSLPEAVDITVASATKGAAAAWLAGHLGTSLAGGARLR